MLYWSFTSLFQRIFVRWDFFPHHPRSLLCFAGSTNWLELQNRWSYVDFHLYLWWSSLHAMLLYPCSVIGWQGSFQTVLLRALRISQRCLRCSWWKKRPGVRGRVLHHPPPPQLFPCSKKHFTPAISIKLWGKIMLGRFFFFFFKRSINF